MSELGMMFVKGAGVGAWIVGVLLVVAVALPVFGVMFSVIAKTLRAGTNDLKGGKG